jgi:hypothetical protein
MTVIAGLDGFEKSLGELPRAGVEVWLPYNIATAPGVTANDNNHPERHFWADFNGDGALDYMWERNGWYVATSNGHGFNTPTLWLSDTRTGNQKTWNNDHPARHFVADFNGDHKADYLWENQGWWVALSTGSAFTMPTQVWLVVHPNNTIGDTFSENWWLHFVADFNHDGMADLMWQRNGWWVALSNGTGFNTPTKWLAGTRSNGDSTFNPDSPERHFIADFDGDGVVDYMWENGGWWVALSNSNGFDMPTSKWLQHNLSGIGDTFGEKTWLQFVGNFDGQYGKDLMWMRNGWWVALAKQDGTGFNAPTKWLFKKNPAWANGETFNPNRSELHFIADFDGDGRDDYLWGWHGWKVALSAGQQFEGPRWWLPSQLPDGTSTDDPNNRERNVVGDFTGDPGHLPEFLWERNGWHVASTLLQDVSTTGGGDPDSDCDGIPDTDDNCPVDWNPDRADADNDGVGNVCDTECSDGIDNDNDSKVDYPTDPGCRTPDDQLEAPECNDGIDNDGDGPMDMFDPNCVAPYIDDERYVRMNDCSDGRDNDADGKIDSYGGPHGEPPDPVCSYNTGFEDYPYHQCGLGFEVAPVLVAIMILRSRRRRAR